MAEALTAIPERRRLWVEFLAFFVTAPVLIAVLLPASAMFPALFAFTALGLLLLHITPGFSWAELRWNWRGWDWRELLAFAVFMTLLSVTLIYAMRPSSAFQLVREQPQLLAFIWIGYPLVSALPQELLFRPLFFRRYRPILPPGLAGRGLNAAVFSLAHLMYWSWVVALLKIGRASCRERVSPYV
mgnify:FL=1